MTPSPWIKTGRVMHRRRFLIGPRRLKIEERRREFRPVVTGHSPANWQPVLRWRWATRAEKAQADLAWLRDRSAEFAGTIPMPPCIKVLP